MTDTRPLAPGAIKKPLSQPKVGEQRKPQPTPKPATPASTGGGVPKGK